MPHKLDDRTLITPALLHRFEQEAHAEGGTGQYYALIRRSEGELLSHHPFGLPAVPEQIMWAADMLKLLNRELHHDGAWVVVFTHPAPAPALPVLHDHKHADYQRYCLLWLDADGDVQFVQEWEAGTGELHDFADVLLAGPLSTAQKCEASWQQWRAIMDALDTTGTQRFKRAKGERAPSQQGRMH